jgi:hypothetical protein
MPVDKSSAIDVRRHRRQLAINPPYGTCRSIEWRTEFASATMTTSHGERWSFAMAVSLRGDFDAARLRGLAKKTKDGPQARRVLALATIYDGATRTEAAKIGGVGLQIIRD